MAKKVKYLKNVPLKKDDKVICIEMDDQFSPVKLGTPGIVTTVNEVEGSKIYGVNWLNKSKHALLQGVDKWYKVVAVGDDEGDELYENVIFSTTKGKILNEIKRK
jgi:hypothetical protein